MRYGISISVYGTLTIVLCYLISFLVGWKKVNLMVSIHGKVMLHWRSEHLKFNINYAQIAVIYFFIDIIYGPSIAPPT